MKFRRCGKSGLLLPSISLGLWHNFGRDDSKESAREMVLRAFDLGITHFDLGNNYGPPPGSAEETFGTIMRSDLGSYRDEILISTKAGYRMWDGPYQDGGSRKYLLSSLDASLRRLSLDYVDIFYHHRPDPNTPLEETTQALSDAVRQGKALYVGISNYYEPELAQRAFALLRDLGTPVIVHQPVYNMLKRDIERSGLLDLLQKDAVGCVVFSPLAQGLLTDRYIEGLPKDSRATKKGTFLERDHVTDEAVARARALGEIARERNQSLAQMALAWNLRHPQVTSVIIGASKASQIDDCVGAIGNTSFSEVELRRIDELLG